MLNKIVPFDKLSYKLSEKDSEVQLEKIITETNAEQESKWVKLPEDKTKKYDSADIAFMEEVYNEMRSGHNLLIDDPEMERWQYFSDTHFNDFDFYREKAKYIFKTQLKYRHFLEAYRRNEK